MAKHHGLYDSSPSIKHEEGKAKVVKPKKENTESDKGVSDEGFPIHARHAHERHTIHAKHEHEHTLHEHHYGVHGKEEMHTRHEHEMKEMHTRHEKEAEHTDRMAAGSGGSTGEPVDKIEKNAKG